ncbi:MAG: glycogen/starch/alpha-glucan phosphorylase [Candidatus Eremiobacteraeota bacterium]|nr:glycogen/starch/alpha-glucan phosphorylase [Candidatus Eremiobacteraeota bacterium]
MSKEAWERAFLDNLLCLQGRPLNRATPLDMFRALAFTVRDRLVQRWAATQQAYHSKKVKRVYYLSAEFLMGRLLANNLMNLGVYEVAQGALAELGVDLGQLLEREADAGLGNGGLGRLAACFLDSMATLSIPGMGYGIRYEYGIFEQRIEKGYQVEQPDPWLRNGNPWEIVRPEYTLTVRMGGRCEAFMDKDQRYRIRWVDTQDVLGVPHDTPIAGFANNTVNNLRLWQCRATKEFDFQEFDQGDYEKSVQKKTESENISKCLYPNDNSMQGKELRLKQQYFFVSCSIQDIVRRHLQDHGTLNNFSQYVSIQLNDTHPTLAIPELLRILLDEHRLEWKDAWTQVVGSFAYTNHTLLPEALEKWPISFLERLLPRHLELIYEINARFLDEVRARYPNDLERLRNMSLIEENPRMVRMAHLAVVGSYSINGVAALHTELLRTRVLTDFANFWPQRFNNKTNGVTPRRWLQQCNPGLAALLNETIGDGWQYDLEQLQGLEKFVEDPVFRNRFREVKRQNKARLAEHIFHTSGLEVELDSIFDIQVKRFHEYKRQHLNALHIIHLYNQLKRNPKSRIVPRTFIFAGKAAPGYFLAKRIIKLINSIAEVVNHDADVAGRIKVVFLENYSVSLAELLIPAADVSEQISTAGYEASGTGNMKFALNGAITLGTLDGANVEIRQLVGAENFFLFGLTAEEVVERRARGYNPFLYYEHNVGLREVIDRVAQNGFTPKEKGIFHPILNELLSADRFMVMADFSAYVEAQRKVSEAFLDRENWTRMAIRNTARSGYFSSDRTIRQYAEEIWEASSVPIEMSASGQFY